MICLWSVIVEVPVDLYNCYRNYVMKEQFFEEEVGLIKHALPLCRPRVYVAIRPLIAVQ